MVIGSDMSHDLWGPWREEIAADHEEERYYLNTDTGEKRAADDPPPPLDAALGHAQRWLATAQAAHTLGGGEHAVDERKAAAQRWYGATTAASRTAAGADAHVGRQQLNNQG